jgi:hypothetical protein
MGRRLYVLWTGVASGIRTLGGREGDGRMWVGGRTAAHGGIHNNAAPS